MLDKRIDTELGTLLNMENVAWYADGRVRILDRRVYPIKKEYVICESYKDVRKAIFDMVTQSGGPYVAASMGMVLAAYEARKLDDAAFRNFMKQAAHDLAHSRPTTSARMVQITENALRVAENSMNDREHMVETLMEHAVNEVTARYKIIRKQAKILADLTPKSGTVITMCFADTVIGLILQELRAQGKGDVAFIAPETRPYLQGARLTAGVVAEMGFDVHVITDNMPGYIMKAKNVDLFFSAADVITMSGHIVNKIGTFQMAVMANYHGIPYFAMGRPDKAHPSADTVKIEERDANDVMAHMGVKVTAEGVNAYYPAFDITPPHLVSGVITDKGMFSAFDLKNYFK